MHVTENTLTRAIADIRSVLGDDAADPRFIQTVARRGYRFIGQVTTAAEVPADPFADWEKGKLSLELLDARQLAEAAQSFDRAIAASPTYAPAHAALASACFLQYERTRSENVPQRDALERAIALARRACELDPSLGEAWATLGFALLASGNVAQARAAARQATALEPTSWRHHFRLAVATWGEERLRAVDRTLSLLPDFAQARFLAAMVFVARQAFDTAEALIVKGAARQTQESAAATAPFPSFGLHWLHGLVLLHRGAVGDALRAFVREIDTGRETSVYYPEFRLNATIASGFAHLSAKDGDGAVRAFREALEQQPANGRGLIGLHTSADPGRRRRRREGRASPRGDHDRRALQGRTRCRSRTDQRGRRDAAGRHDAAVATLDLMLDHVPLGQVGWQLPIDPALAGLRTEPGFERLLARVAARAS